MPRQPKTRGVDRQRRSPALHEVAAKPLGAGGVAGSAHVALLAPASAQAIPTLANVPTSYDWEENSGTLLSLCHVLAEREIGAGDLWQRTNRNVLRFAVAAIQSKIERACGELLSRNVNYQLVIQDTVDDFGRAELREGVLALMVECDGCGYLRIGPALDALEAEAPGLGAAFYNLFRFSLYRWMRTYDHADAQQYNETLHEWAAQDDEANQSAYEFPDVEESIPAFVRSIPELHVGTLRRFLRQHRDGRCGTWVRSLLKLHALCRFRSQIPREIFEDIWDDQPLPVLLVTFQDRDGIAACFEAESQSMYEASHEPAFCAVFSPDKAEEVDAALLSFRRFLAINLELFTLVEALNQHEAPHEDPHIDRQHQELLAQ